jgi:hypothetical protein
MARAAAEPPFHPPGRRQRDILPVPDAALEVLLSEDDIEAAATKLVGSA